MARQSTEVRQRQIIQAARQIITTRGMEDLTIEALADEVGLTEGAIYRHFASKQEILMLLLQEIEEVLFSTLSQAQKGVTGSTAKLERILQAHLSIVEQRRGVSFILIAEALRFGDPELRVRVAQLLERYTSYIREVLEEGVKMGELRKDLHLETAAQAFFGMVQGVVTFWSLEERSSSLAERHQRLWDLFRQGIVVAA